MGTEKEIQRFCRAAEICRRCAGINTFRVVGAKRTKGGRVDYLRCASCGQRATRIIRVDP